MRLFVAFDVPEHVLRTLQETTRRLAPVSGNARWVKLAGTHVTLKFLGEVASERVGAIQAALSGIQHGPFEISYRGLGFFPNEHRPRVLWAGVGTIDAEPSEPGAGGGSTLAHLAAEIEAVLAPLGIPREKREFKPHLTLARFDSAKRLDALRAGVRELSTTEFGRSTAECFHLYRSVLKPSGAEYTRIETYPISGERRLDVSA